MSCHAIELAQPTVAWLIAAPMSRSTRTHSTCPLSLAISSGVQPFVCHATRHSHRNHHALMPRLTTALTRML
jgi:hypothetical protein